MADYSFGDFTNTVAELLGENGCPWDKSRTFENLREDLLEECCEALDAAGKNDAASLCEELGDVMLTVMLYVKIAEKDGLFALNDVINGITEKIIRRHSHVFGDKKAVTPEESLANWDAEKRLEKKYASETERLKAVPRTLPSLMRAQKVLKRAASGKNEADGVKTRADEISRLTAELVETPDGGADLTGVIGGILLRVADISRFLEINAELALTNTIETFINVFENAGNVAIASFDGNTHNF